MKSPLIIKGKNVHVDHEYISDMGQILGVMHQLVGGMWVIYMECVEGFVMLQSDDLKNMSLALNPKWWAHPNKYLKEPIAIIVGSNSV